MTEPCPVCVQCALTIDALATCGCPRTGPTPWYFDGIEEWCGDCEGFLAATREVRRACWERRLREMAEERKRE